jgi:hypothetical protein
MSKKRSLAALCLILALVNVSSVEAADGTPPPAFQMPEPTESVPRPDDLVPAGEPDSLETVLYSNAKVEIERYSAETVAHIYPLKEADALCIPGDVEPNTGSPPQLSGTPSPGNVLTVSNGSWVVCGPFSVSYSYRWSTGVSSQTYLVQSSDVGRQVNATVTACTSEDCAASTSNTVTITDSGGGGGGGGGGGNPCSENDPSQLFSQFAGMTAVPASVTTGQTFAVSITFQNAGQCTWTGADGYRLGSQSPENNTNWGFNRVYLAAGEAIGPGQSKTFVLNATAPTTPGAYGFQWRMVREFVNWFGPNTPSATVNVTSPQPSCSGTVVLYDGPGYTGSCWAYGAGQYPNLGLVGDRASSIRVADGYVATLFSGTDYAGNWANTVTAPDASGWGAVGDNSASSMIVQAEQNEPEPLTSYSSVDPSEPFRKTYGNGCWRVSDGFSNYSQYGRRALTYKLSTSFCKSSGRVSFVGSREIIVDLPPFPFPLNLINAWRYNESFFLPGESGGSSTILKVQGIFDFCIFKYGCPLSYIKWIKIELYGDGQAICSNSEDQRRRNCARQSL